MADRLSVRAGRELDNQTVAGSVAEVGASTAEKVQIAALQLFATRGFQATGIRDIARQANISVASLYHYMHSKEDLLMQIMRDDMEVLVEGARDILESTVDPIEQVTQLVAFHVGRHARYSLRAIVGDTELRSLSEDSRREIVGLRDHYEIMWRETITTGARQGQFRIGDVKMSALALLEMCTGVAHWYSPNGRMTMEEIVNNFVDMALSLLNATDLPRELREGRKREARHSRKHP